MQVLVHLAFFEAFECAVMVVIGNELGDPPSVEEMIEMMLSEIPVKGIDVSDIKPRTIGDRRGIRGSVPAKRLPNGYSRGGGGAGRTAGRGPGTGVPGT